MSTQAARSQFTLATLSCVVFLTAIGLLATRQLVDPLHDFWYPDRVVAFLALAAAMVALCVAACLAARRKSAFVAALILSAIAFYFAGELAWIALLVAWTSVGVVRLRQPSFRVVALVASAAILLAHENGFKVYGSATLYDNRPVLTRPQRLQSVESPNILVTDDGMRMEVRGFVFNGELFELSQEDLLRVFDPGYNSRNSQSQVLVELPQRETTSGVVFEHRGDYGCGNAYFPRFFPKRYPWFFADDVGEHLWQLELATKK